MTIVYLDVLWLLNFAANYMLLLSTARMSGTVIRRGRMMIAACFGAVYAVLCVLGTDWIGHPLCKLSVGVLMCVIAFGTHGNPGRIVLIFYGVSAALGGAIWALELLGGNTLMSERGVLYSRFDIRILLPAFAVCFALFRVVGERMLCHRHSELVSVELAAHGKSIRLTALVDTGNTLTDPATNRPVLVVEGEACRPLLPRKVQFDDPVSALEQLNRAGECGFRLIPYRTVGNANGLMLAMRVDCRLGARGKKKTILAAFSPTKVSDGGGYQALIGGKEWI